MDEKNEYLCINEISKKYNDIQEIWSKNDIWHYITRNKIDLLIEKYKYIIRYNFCWSIVNIGSGGNPYSFPENNMLHIDIAADKIKSKKYFLCARIEELSKCVGNSSYDICLCVGSVLNYSNDVFLSIQNIASVLKNNSYLILEFESSCSFEYLFTKNYNKKAVIVKTFYNNKEEKLWVYSEKYIIDILNKFGFNILKINRFHIISSLLYRITKNSYISSKFSIFDFVFSFIPFFSKRSSNIMVLARYNN